MSRSFIEKARDSQNQRQSRLCVGLDPDPRKMPAHLLSASSLSDAVIAFNRAIIEATEPYACGFKLNLAFFEALGREGWRVLEESISAVSPESILIADGKRGDIGNSAEFYARSVFQQLGFDACTVTPYMGRDAVEPFLQFEGKAAFVLSRTSNPGANDLQEWGSSDELLYERVIRLVSEWSKDAPGTAGFVVGATDERALASVRKACPHLPLLIPGVGAQGGSTQQVTGITSHGTGPVIVNSSRQVLYASQGTDFASAAALAANSIRKELQPA